MKLQFGILGPLEVRAEERLELGGPRPRRLLVMLLLHAGRMVSRERLVEAVWEDRPPARAEATLRAHVAKLRRALGAAGEDHLVTRSPGYGLLPAPEQIDAHRFGVLVEDGRAALGRGEPDRVRAPCGRR